MAGAKKQTKPTPPKPRGRPRKDGKPPGSVSKPAKPKQGIVTPTSPPKAKSQGVSFDSLCNPTERQREFMRTVRDHMFTLYGGAAGGGKSYILRWTLLGLLIKWASLGHLNVRVGLFCEDYPALRDRHLSRIRFEFPAELGIYRETTHEFELKKEYGGGVISFRNLDDPSKYLSSEFAAIAIDELTKNQQDVFDFLRMRLRWPGINEPKFIAATNPGGPGHGWVKSLWIDRIFPAELRDIASEFAFVPAKAVDNPHLPPSYASSMQTLPEHLRKAYADGSWDVFAGQAFTEWSRDKHVCEPFDVPRGWVKYRAMDWGYSKPYAILWGAVDYDGVLYITDEMYGYNGVDVGTQETAEDVAARVVSLAKAGKVVNEDIISVADPACWAKTGHSGPSIAEQFIRGGVYFRAADNDRIQGKMQIHQRLKNGKIKVFSSCKHLIRTLPSLVYDKTKVEDIDTTQEDHLYDALRYLCMARPYKTVKPAEPKRDWLGRVREEKVDWTAV